VRDLTFSCVDARQIVGLGVLIAEVSRSHSYTTHAVGLLWASDRPVRIALPYKTQHSQETGIHAAGGIRTYNPSKRTAAHPRLRPRGHLDRLTFIGGKIKFYVCEGFQKCPLVLQSKGRLEGIREVKVVR
jgi:hypothetical protein